MSTLKYKSLKHLSYKRAWVDIIETITLSIVNKTTARFTYSAGIPHAYEFGGLELYKTEADAVAGRNRISETIYLPKYTITPEIPESDGQNGFIEFEPVTKILCDALYGKLLICQEEQDVYSEKEEPLTPNEQRGPKQLIPKWER